MSNGVYIRTARPVSGLTPVILRFDLSPSGPAIYLTDVLNNTVEKFTDTGSSLGQIIDTQPGGGGAGPQAVAVSANGRLYAVDRDSHRVQTFDSAGIFLAKFGRNGGEGTSGNADGEFDTPRGIDIAPTGEVYVSDGSNHRVQRWFDPEAWVSGTNKLRIRQSGPWTLPWTQANCWARHLHLMGPRR